MPGLDTLLSRVVERKGYTVAGADAEALFAKKGDETLLAAWKTDAPLNAEDARIFLTAMDQVHAATGILVAVKGVDPAAKDALQANKSVEVWAESRLVVEVGEAYVRDALDGHAAAPTAYPMTPAPAATPAPTTGGGSQGNRKFPSLVAQAATAAGGGNSHGIAYYMPNKKKEAPADMQATIPQQRGGSLGYAWGGMAGGPVTDRGIAQTMPSKPRIKTDQWGNVVREGAKASAATTVIPAADVEITGTPRRRVANPAATGAAPPVVMDADEDAYEIIDTKKKAPAKTAGPGATIVKDASPPACTTLRVTVSREDAIAKTGKAGTAKLALVPHVAFEYDVSVDRPGMSAPMTGSGALLINSLSGEVRHVDGLAFNDAEPAEVARKDQEKLTAVDVYDKVKGFMAKTFSKTLNVEKEVAGNTVMSTIKVTPEPEEMGLNHRGIVHLPVWEVSTSTGVVKIDAFTGATI